MIWLIDFLSENSISFGEILSFPHKDHSTLEVQVPRYDCFVKMVQD